MLANQCACSIHDAAVRSHRRATLSIVQASAEDAQTDWGTSTNTLPSGLQTQGHSLGKTEHMQDQGKKKELQPSPCLRSSCPAMSNDSPRLLDYPGTCVPVDAQGDDDHSALFSHSLMLVHFSSYSLSHFLSFLPFLLFILPSFFSPLLLSFPLISIRHPQSWVELEICRIPTLTQIIALPSSAQSPLPPNIRGQKEHASFWAAKIDFGSQFSLFSTALSDTLPSIQAFGK